MAECERCKKPIDEWATRCPYCTTEFEHPPIYGTSSGLSFKADKMWGIAGLGCMFTLLSVLGAVVVAIVAQAVFHVGGPVFWLFILVFGYLSLKSLIRMYQEP